MRRWFYFVAMKWFDFVDILAVVLGHGLQSLILFLFGWSFGYYVVLRMVRAAAAADPALANAIGFIPPLVLELVPYAVAVALASLPWLIPFMPVLRRKPLEPQESDADYQQYSEWQLDTQLRRGHRERWNFIRRSLHDQRQFRSSRCQHLR